MLLNVIMASLGLFSVQLSSQKSLACNKLSDFKYPKITHSRMLQTNKINSYKANCVVTAYTPYPQENGGSGFTRMGHRARKGLLAVDPRVIPMGSKIYIKGYGWGIADDTGGKIKGNMIDICLPSRHLATRWGRKKIEVIIFPGKHKTWKSRHKP
jgi:3D (Asp-Asp-Asp) domain-containing protein